MVRSTLQFDADFDTIDAPAKNAVENPQEATASSQAVIRNSFASDMPEIGLPGKTHVVLAQGIIRDGAALRDAEVRELTGEDEEALARAGSSWVRYLDTIVTRGTIHVGGHPMTKAIADELLIGDREELILAVRKATFGTTIEIEDHECPECGKRSDLTVDLDTIPHVGLEDATQTVFPVKLRGKRIAEVRFPTGADQAAIYLDADATVAESNTTLLARCVLKIDGEAPRTKFVAEEMVRELGIADRRKILRFLADEQPGPRFTKINYTHEACGQVINLPLGLADLFLGV